MFLSNASNSPNFTSVSDGLSSDDSFKSILSLHESLESNFSDVLKNFNLVHINAQSIPAHYPDMLSTFDSKNIHAILVSESWLKPCLPSTSYALPGFRLIRNDRSLRGGGGVAIYLRSHIPFSIIRMSPQSQLGNEAEYLFIELIFSSTKILLGVFYSPSLTVDYFSSLETHLEDLTPLYSHTIIMGDFNTCLIKNDNRSNRLISVMEAANMHILPLSATHYFPNCKPSLLDLICVSSNDHVAKHGQYAADAFSYHDLLYLSYKIRPPKAKPRILLQRNFSGIDSERLLEDAAKIDWNVIYDADNVDNKVALFNSLITQLLDVHAPVRPVKVKHLPAPWLNDEVRKLMVRKNDAKLKYKFDPSDFNRDKYKFARNHCNKVCRDLQRRHIHSSVQSENPARVWKFLRSLGIGKSRQDNFPDSLDLNVFNQHFSSSSCISNDDKNDTLNFLSTFPIPDTPKFTFNLLTDRDVKKSILSIDSDAIGCDGISRKMIYPLIDYVTPIITYILNCSLSTSTFPSIWKDAEVIPLPKKNNPLCYADFRPISILPFLSKVLERLVHNQLSSFLLKHNLFNPFQSGFRPGHSTTTALLKITDDIRSGMEYQKFTVLILLDFSNAFNTVDFDILLGILYSLNISPAVTGWFQSYLRGRRQRIKLQDNVSSWNTTCAGVPQGGVLSPLLFSIFINSISHQLSSSYHLYADDLQIYTQSTIGDLSASIAAINADLACILKWSKSYGITVNPKKTQAIIIGSSRLQRSLDLSQLPTVSFDGVTIPFSDKVKNLGVYIDCSFSWVPQIKEVSKKVFASLSSLRRLRNLLPHPTKISLAQTLILPILDYADSCYLDLTEEQFNKLERLQNACIRFIFGIRKYDHITEFRNKLGWLPIRLRRNTRILSLLYSVLFNPAAPSYLKERFQFLCDSSNRSYRSSHALTLRTPIHSSSFYTKSFTVVASRLWNCLPLEIQRAQNLETFKSRLKAHYLT